MSTVVITALLAGFLTGVAAQHALTTANQAWRDAKEKAETRIKLFRWDG